MDRTDRKIDKPLSNRDSLSVLATAILGRRRRERNRDQKMRLELLADLLKRRAPAWEIDRQATLVQKFQNSI